MRFGNAKLPSLKDKLLNLEVKEKKEVKEPVKSKGKKK